MQNLINMIKKISTCCKIQYGWTILTMKTWQDYKIIHKSIQYGRNKCMYLTSSAIIVEVITQTY